MMRSASSFGVLGSATLVVASLAACSPPVGDFGRREPSYLNDTLLPAIGHPLASRLRKEPVSTLAMTDDEKELEARAWAFVRAPHDGDWWFDVLAEGERSRILPLIAGKGGVRADPGSGIPPRFLPLFSAAFDPERYHRFLMEGDFASTESRWNRVIDDMAADRALIPPFCAAAARVRAADITRMKAASGATDKLQPLVKNAEARVADNNRTMAWVWNAIGYRTASYRDAIDRLEIEAPSARLAEARHGLRDLAGETCAGTPSRSAAWPVAERHSRLMAPHDPFYDPVPQK